MKYFYDTEFLEQGPGKPISLISIGMVCEDGRRFYAVNREADWNTILQDPWLSSNVVATLGVPPQDWMTAYQIQSRLEDFMYPSKLGDQKPELWAYFAAYDHVVFSQIWSTMIRLPDWMPKHTMDLKQEMVRRGVTKLNLPPQLGTAHNALEDAEWVREAHNFLEGQT